MNQIEVKKFSVWVGGTEVNDYLMTKEDAESLAYDYILDNYDDVLVVEN